MNDYPTPQPIAPQASDHVQSARDFLHHDYKDEKLVGTMLKHLAELPTKEEYWQIINSGNEADISELYHRVNTYRGQVAMMHHGAQNRQQEISLHVRNTDYYIRRVEAEHVTSKQGKRVLRNLHRHYDFLSELVASFRTIEREAAEQLRLLDRLPHAINAHAHHWVHYNPADLALYDQVYDSYLRLMDLHRD